MPDNIDNLVLEHLRALRADMADMKEIMRDNGRRLTAMEIALGNMAATEMSHYANTALRADKTDDRLDRIDRRLDLKEA